MCNCGLCSPCKQRIYYQKNKTRIQEWRRQRRLQMTAEEHKKENAYKIKRYHATKLADAPRRKETEKVRRQRNKDIIVATKQASGCSRCPERDIDCLDFHHVDPTTKRFTIGKYRHDIPSIDNLKAEIAKCVVLCANCHRKQHARERSLHVGQ